MATALYRQRLLLLLGILTAFGLRLFHLGQESLWYDETVSVLLARKPIPALLAHTAGDIHPPGYYLLLHFWQQLTEPTILHGLEYLFAWPSLCFGMLVVALLYPLGRRLLSTGPALVALWLAAVQPYQIWYSQEVRMYTMGAALGLLCLWATINIFTRTKGRQASVVLTQSPSILRRKDAESPTEQRQRWRWLLLYAVAGALGLYTLYYFLFLLVAFNLAALGFFLPLRKTKKGPPPASSPISPLGHWFTAQLLLLLLWTPWLPTFWRQATDPPVPPWRVPWDSSATFLAAVSESISALLVGQSAPLPTHWIWLLVALLFLGTALFCYTNSDAHHSGIPLLLWYTFFPIVLIFGITALITPLYHVRYLVLYAPPLLLLIAGTIHSLYHRSPLPTTALLLLLLAVNGWSLRAFWFAPQFQSDDHQSAVATLARGWRPGDLILVNAGWAYTALQTYWPTQVDGGDGAIPPPIGGFPRLLDYAQSANLGHASLAPRPTVVRTGSINGAPDLGWGDPQSDFFAISPQETTTALTTLQAKANRIWHYRLYDTVNDEAGLIRTWLAANGTLLLDQPLPGRDFLRLQLYALDQEDAPTPKPTSSTAHLHLEDVQIFPNPPHAGQMLYLQSRWWRQADPAALPADLRFSLRLYDTQGHLVAQQDEAPLRSVREWPTDEPTALALALPIPVAVPPGDYTLQLLLYDGATGIPVMNVVGKEEHAALTIGQIALALPQAAPELTSRLARFDYIDLVHAAYQPSTVTTDGALTLDLVWLPRANAYRDTYVVRWSLLDSAGNHAQQWEEALGGWAYPSGIWPPEIPVRQQVDLPLATTVAPGRYELVMDLFRHTDGQPIPARVRWWRAMPHLSLGFVRVE